MLRLDNCRDEDWLTFLNVRPSKLTNPGERSIPLHNAIILNFINGKNGPADPFKSVILYQYSRDFHSEEDYIFNHFDIFEHKAVWIECLKSYINSEKIEQLANSGEVLPKRFYHLLYQYYMIIENAHWISDSAKEKVQKIHDLEMPTSYFYELKKMINRL